ncbi:uncharacterized protein LOC123314721 [Coccinella septempunctata]|uniref:uncharacterized protein LOC123314721 n=1 Tax=Coccinella septempunctata TaxID=41139 RepID=UPI001D07D918|nr:uncharacterized protein LOC123314721 [Coccinella septempunctata]
MISDEILGDISAAVKEIMKTEGFEDYKFEIEGMSESGDNYMGEVIFLRVEPLGDDGKSYHLVLKTAKRSKDLRGALPIEIFYNRELYMYSDVFPAYRTFIKEVRPDFGFDFLPRVLYFNREYLKETIVMENLKNEGFKLWDRKKPWNLQHSLFAMRHYGKLHALSMALEDQRPGIFGELRKNLGNISDVFDKRVDFKKFYEEPVEHIMGLLRKNGREDLVVKYDGLVEEALDHIFNGKTEDEDRIAICHMDSWNNNFMFKYENDDESEPSEVRLLDFQLSVMDSPAKDLSYNIYATCDNSCLDHFDDLLQTYHRSLVESLRSLGSDPSNFFSLEDLRRHWRKYGLYGLFLSITLIKIELLEKTDAPKIEEMAKHENMLDGFNVKVSDQEEYDRRILDVYIHFGDNFL